LDFGFHNSQFAAKQFSADCQIIRILIFFIYYLCGKLKLERIPARLVTFNTRSASVIRSPGQRWWRIREPLGPMKAHDEATGKPE